MGRRRFGEAAAVTKWSPAASRRPRPRRRAEEHGEGTVQRERKREERSGRCARSPGALRAQRRGARWPDGEVVVRGRRRPARATGFDSRGGRHPSTAPSTRRERRKRRSRWRRPGAPGWPRSPAIGRGRRRRSWRIGSGLGLGFREGRGSRGGSTRGGLHLSTRQQGAGRAAQENATATAWRRSAIAVATVERERGGTGSGGPLSSLNFFLFPSYFL